MKFRHLKAFLIGSLAVLIIVAGIVVADRIIRNEDVFTLTGRQTEQQTEIVYDPFLLSDSINVDLLTPNENSRPQKELREVNAIVIHYVANPGTTAKQNRNYFEGLKDSKATSASSHYIVGLDGEIIQCIPLNEISYASNDRNSDTIAIECCHPDATGKFNDKTYDALVLLTAALCKTYNLSPEKDIIRHYDVTGKLCPLYYVENEDEWYGFKLAVKTQMSL